ncbi:MAG: DUF1631 domain-containing protein, partial [Gammaproteobacteria bacterium]|nr:DUF1631 domain-containing protein [Gammaproteobacteria bacterium]
RGVAQSFRQNLGNGFHAMYFSSPIDSTDANLPPVLVSDAEPELESVLNRINRKFRAVSAAELYKTTVRFDAISDDCHVVEANNALSAQNLCEYFSRACQLVSLDTNSRKVLFQLFDRYVIRILPKVLEEVNGKLSAAGILSEFSTQLTNSANQQQNAEVDPNQSEQSPFESDESSETFSHLKKLLANDLNAASGETSIKAGVRLLARGDLLEILSSLQRNIRLSDGLDANISSINISEQVFSVLSQRQDQYVGNTLATDDTEIIVLVEKLFNAILEDTALSDLVKASLSRMQIPLVKLGLIDSTFFIERDHVGRRLINELARLGGGDENKSEMARSVLYTKVEEVSQRIIREFNEDISVFENQLNDLMLFYNRTQSRADEMEQRSKIATDGQEKLDLARSVISQNVNLLMKDKTVPSVVEKILLEGWSDLLLVSLLKEGVPSDGWGDFLLTAEELVWSVQPGKDRAARQRLLQLVPQLLSKLQEGLAIINFESFSLSEILTDLEQEHLAIFGLRKELDDEPVREEPSVPAELYARTQAKNKASLGEVASISGDIADITRQIMSESVESKQGEEQAVNGAEPAAPADLGVAASNDEPLGSGPNKQEIESMVDQLNLGVWFEVHSSEGKGKYRCKLAAHLVGYNKYIFVNRRGEKVIERSRDNLVGAIASGEMVILQETQLFDRALQSVVSDLRNSK